MALLFRTGDGNNWKLLVIPLYITATTFGMLKGMRMNEVITFLTSTKSLTCKCRNYFPGKIASIQSFFLSINSRLTSDFCNA